METKAEYVADTYAVDKLLMRDIVVAIKAGEITFYGLIAISEAHGLVDSRHTAWQNELRATLTQIYDRWPELAN